MVGRVRVLGGMRVVRLGRVRVGFRGVRGVRVVMRLGGVRVLRGVVSRGVRVLRGVVRGTGREARRRIGRDARHGRSGGVGWCGNSYEGSLLALGVVVRSDVKLTSDDEESGEDELGEVHHLCWWWMREIERERCRQGLLDEVCRAESSRGRY